MLKISVLMPAYNSAKYISESISSILDQTYSNFELIIVDDCSTDDTWQIIKNFAKRDKRIIALKNEKNLDIAANRNKALDVARGEYIAWQDADDISYPKRLMSQKEYLDRNSEVGIVGGYLDFFSDRCEYISTRKYPETDSEIRNIIFRYTPVAQPAAMIRKECFKNVGNFDKKIAVAEDLDMNFRIGEQYQFANIQEPVIRYRLNDTSSTFKRLKLIELNTINIRRKYFDNPKYNAKTSDKIYNYLQYLSIYLIPAKLKIKIFNFLRNTK